MVAPMAQQAPAPNAVQMFNLLTRNYKAQMFASGSNARQTNGGNTIVFPVPTAGLLSRLWISSKGQINALTGTPSKYGQSAFYRSVRLKSSTTNDLFNLRGPSYFGILLPYIDFPGNSAPQSTGWTAIASSALVNLPLVIPCSVNARDTTGLLVAQNRDTLLTLELEWETLANLASTSLTMTTELSTKVYAESFTVPPNPAAMPFLNMIHQIIDRTETISAGGSYRHDWDRSNLYLQKFHGAGFQVTTPVDNWTTCRLKANVTQDMYYKDPDAADMETPWFRPGVQRRAGIIPFDLWGQSGLGNYDVPRDAIPSWDYSSLVSDIDFVTSGDLWTVSRQLVRI